MIFSIRDLSFELGSLFLEGWLAFAAVSSVPCSFCWQHGWCAAG